jgi:hypothetical protein
MCLTDASTFLISCVIQHYAPVVGTGWRNRCIMLIMTLDPRWRQTLSLPPMGIEPGSPAPQAGTLPKELSRQLIPVVRIRYVYPRSRILIFSLTNFLDNEKILTPSQFGFRRSHSTAHAMVHFLNNISKALNEKKHTIAIFCDLRKAFDTVDHDILLKKLHKMGVRAMQM